MANYDNVRLFVINALKQYHAVHSAAEADTIAGILADYPTSAEWDSTNKEISLNMVLPLYLILQLMVLTS